MSNRPKSKTLKKKLTKAKPSPKSNIIRGLGLLGTGLGVGLGVHYLDKNRTEAARNQNLKKITDDTASAISQLKDDYSKINRYVDDLKKENAKLKTELTNTKTENETLTRKLEEITNAKWLLEININKYKQDDIENQKKMDALYKSCDSAIEKWKNNYALLDENFKKCNSKLDLCNKAYKHLTSK